MDSVLDVVRKEAESCDCLQVKPQSFTTFPFNVFVLMSCLRGIENNFDLKLIVPIKCLNKV